jgi:hypothetical protein
MLLFSKICFYRRTLLLNMIMGGSKVDKRPLIVVSICAVVLLVLGSLTNVVGGRLLNTFHPTDDTRLDQSEGGPGGASQFIYTRNRQGYSGNYYEIDALIRFDISSLAPGSRILSARLWLFYNGYNDNNPARRWLTLYCVTSDWNEETASWPNQPSYDQTPTSEAKIPFSPGHWISWDVTKDVRDFVNGDVTNFGWRIADNSGWGGADIPRADFRSKEYGLRIPTLRILAIP